MSTVFKTTADLAVKKTTGLFNAIATTSSGVVLWDFGDGQTQKANTANYTYSNNQHIPFLINIINSETYELVIGLDLASNELTAVDVSRFKNLTSLDISDNLLPAEELNKVLIELDNFGKLNGTLDYANNLGLPNSLEAQEAYNNLIAKGWIITGAAPFEEFIFTIDTTQSGTSANDQFTLPLTTGTYDLEIDWGDGGAIENYVGTSAITHTFSPVGVYTVSIKANTWSGSIRFNNGGDRLKLINISQFSSQIIFNNTNGMFFGCSNLTISSKSAMKFSSNDFSNIFRQCASLTTEDFNLWDTSSVTTMKNVFWDCTNFNGYIDKWDISNVTNISNIFFNATLFNQPINGWDTSKVVIMRNAFYGASSFNRPLDLWNLESTTVIAGMFQNATSFNGAIGGWDTSNCISMFGVFNGATSFNQDLSEWDVTNVTFMQNMFSSATAFDQNIGSWNVVSLSNAIDMFANINLSTVNYDALLIGWESKNVLDNVSFSGGNSKYTLGGAAEAARQRLITDHNWTIVDGGGI